MSFRILWRSRSSMSTATKYFSLEPFCLRQFNRNQPGHIRCGPDAFINRVNEIYGELIKANPESSHLQPGYAPFCKHFFIPNFTDTQAYAIEITPENRHLLESDYVARTNNELPVLSRWFPKEKVERPVAKYLDVILYSREQIMKENAATGEENVHPESIEWGVISVKAQMAGEEIPMAPITMMRNALPLREGGSGTPLDHDKYLQSVQIWKKFAIVQ